VKRFLHISSGSVWGVRDMRIVLPGRAVSAAGQGMAMVTLVLHLHDSGAGPVATAALFGCLALPTIALMGVAGRAADRYDSRRILVLGHLLEAAACLLLTGLVAGAPWWWCLPAVTLMQTGAAFANPVWSALVPRIVGEERIGSAISWQQGLSTAIAPVGAASSGVLYGLVGPSSALATAATLLTCLAVVARLVHTRRGGPADPAHDADDHAATTAGPSGLQVIRTDPVVWPLFVGLFVLVMCVEGVNVVEVFLARDALGATPQQYGFTEVCFSGGAVAGALAAGRLRTTRARVLATLLGFGGTALTLLLAGVAPNFWTYLVIALFIGLTNAYGNAANGALVMTRVPDTARGQVSSTLGGVMRIGSVLALALGGLAGSLLGPRETFVVAGASGLLAILAALLVVGRRLPTDPQTTMTGGPAVRAQV